MNIIGFELIKYINIEILLPLFAILVVIFISIYSNSFKKLLSSIILFHILIIVVRLVYYFLDINSMNSLSIEINQSNSVEFFIEFFNIQTLKLFIYMVFTLVSIMLIFWKSFSGNKR